jgi:hypothetical protein
MAKKFISLAMNEQKATKRNRNLFGRVGGSVAHPNMTADQSHSLLGLPIIHDSSR